MLPDEQAHNLIDVFTVAAAAAAALPARSSTSAARSPSTWSAADKMSPIDRSVVAEAVREIAAVQRRMDNVAAYLPAEAWTGPAPS